MDPVGTLMSFSVVHILLLTYFFFFYSYFLKFLYSRLARVRLSIASNGPSCRSLAGLVRTRVVSGSPSIPASGVELGMTA